MGHTETFVDGIWYPSATTIIGASPKPWLDKWREKWGALAERKTEISGAIGTAFHDCVEQYLATGSHYLVRMDKYKSCSTRVVGMMQAWIAWANSIEGTIDCTELKVISNLHLYSGTFDAVGKIDKKRYIIDWKTGSRIYPEMALQLVAYAEAYNEMMGSKIKDGLIVHVSKDRPHKVTTKEFKLGKRVFNEFLKLRSMFDEIKVQGEADAKSNSDI